MSRLIALLVALAGAILWAVLAATPPAPLGVDVSATAFSSSRAFADIEAISRAPRPTASAENARVRAYLLARLRTLGAEASEQTVPLPADVARTCGQVEWRQADRLGRPQRDRRDPRQGSVEARYPADGAS